MREYRDAAELITSLDPEDPALCVRTAPAKEAARWFLEHFPGEVLYAMKANPSRIMLSTLNQAGITHFDIASLAELERVQDVCPGSELSVMHPVKSRKFIATAVRDHGVRTMALDSFDELDKIESVVGDLMGELTLVVRLSVADGDSGIRLADKFGIAAPEAIGLLQRCRSVARRVGLSFHVGSQAMRPDAFTDAMDRASWVIRKSGVLVDIIDVGGGFPCVYPDRVPPDLHRYMEAIKEGWERMPVTDRCELWCEPGRALCAAAGSVVTRVELRKGHSLYLNDGTYGSLFDAGSLRFVYPVRVIRPGHPAPDGPIEQFQFFGPTCDGLDQMPGPFDLPSDVREGDWLEIGMLGAYAATMSTRFNGFGVHLRAILRDEAPLVTPAMSARRAAASLSQSKVSDV